MKARKQTKVTKSDYTTAQAMKEVGLPTTKAAKLMNRGLGTVRVLYNSSSIEDYYKRVEDENKSRKQKKLSREEKPQELKEVAAQPSEAEVSAIRLLENLTTEVQAMRKDLNELSEEIEAVIAAKKVAFWRN